MKHENFYEFVCDELKDLDEKAKRGDVSMTDVQYADILEHYKKSYLTNDAMEGAGYSNRYMPYHGGYAYADGEMGGNSYAGRMNAKRDSMGRYSRDGGDYSRNRGNSYGGNGYSYAEDMEQTREEMRELAQKMPEAHRRKIERALDDLT